MKDEAMNQTDFSPSPSCFPFPSNELERIHRLSILKMLDTPPDEAYDRFTRIAARIFQVPIALISIVDIDRQWFKSRIGLKPSITETPRCEAFCTYAILESAPRVMVVRDAFEDDRFRDNPLVLGYPKIRFYAGASLLVDGVRIGTVCIIDHEVRDENRFGEKECRMLEELSDMVSDMLSERYQQQMSLPQLYQMISFHSSFLKVFLVSLQVLRTRKQKIQQTKERLYDLSSNCTNQRFQSMLVELEEEAKTLSKDAEQSIALLNQIFDCVQAFPIDRILNGRFRALEESQDSSYDTLKSSTSVHSIKFYSMKELQGFINYTVHGVDTSSIVTDRERRRKVKSAQVLKPTAGINLQPASHDKATSMYSYDTSPLTSAHICDQATERGDNFTQNDEILSDETPTARTNSYRTLSPNPLRELSYTTLIQLVLRALHQYRLLAEHPSNLFNCCIGIEERRIGNWSDNLSETTSEFTTGFTGQHTKNLHIRWTLQANYDHVGDVRDFLPDSIYPDLPGLSDLFSLIQYYPGCHQEVKLNADSTQPGAHVYEYQLVVPIFVQEKRRGSDFSVDAVVSNHRPIIKPAAPTAIRMSFLATALIPTIVWKLLSSPFTFGRKSKVYCASDDESETVKY